MAKKTHLGGDSNASQSYVRGTQASAIRRNDSSTCTAGTDISEVQDAFLAGLKLVNLVGSGEKTLGASWSQVNGIANAMELTPLVPVFDFPRIVCYSIRIDSL